MQNPDRRCQRGFTLIELIVTIAIAAMLMTLAAPSFVQFRRNSELRALTNTLLSAINAARSEALKTGKNAVVEPNFARDWASGWRVFIDLNHDNLYHQDHDILVLEQEKQPSYFVVKVKNNATGAPQDFIKFNGSGYSPVAVTLSIARNDPGSLEETRRLIVERTGQVRSCKPRSANDVACIDPISPPASPASS